MKKFFLSEAQDFINQVLNRLNSPIREASLRSRDFLYYFFLKNRAPRRKGHNAGLNKKFFFQDEVEVQPRTKKSISDPDFYSNISKGFSEALVTGKFCDVKIICQVGSRSGCRTGEQVNSEKYVKFWWDIGIAMQINLKNIVSVTGFVT